MRGIFYPTLNLDFRHSFGPKICIINDRFTVSLGCTNIISNEIKGMVVSSICIRVASLDVDFNHLKNITEINYKDAWKLL